MLAAMPRLQSSVTARVAGPPGGALYIEGAGHRAVALPLYRIPRGEEAPADPAPGAGPAAQVPVSRYVQTLAADNVCACEP